MQIVQYEPFNEKRATIPGMGDCIVELHQVKGKQKDSLLHWHHALELSLVLQGQVEYYAGQTWFCAEAGDIIFVNSEDIHLTRNATRNGILKNLVILISNRWITSFVPATTQPFFSISKNSDEFSNLLDSMRKIANYIDEPFSYSNMLINRELINILYILYSEFYRPEDAPKLSNVVAKEIIRYINEHYQEDLSLHSVASRFGLQENYFCRYFKRINGTTFHQYLSLVRLNAALSLFIAGQSSALESALQVGFSSEKVMIDWCKKIYHCTPTQYKASMIVADF